MSKDNNKELEEKREEEIERLLQEAKGKATIPEEEGMTFTSREYRRFKEEEKKRKEKNWYEVLAGFSEKLGISPGEEAGEEIKEAAGFCKLKVSPTGVMGLSVLASFGLSILSLGLLLIGTVSPALALLGLAGSVVLFYYLYNYPFFTAKNYRINASSELVMAILYMVIYMKNVPNLEGAVNFAAVNLEGPLAYDFRELIWNVDMRKYDTVDQALAEYAAKWEVENEEFVEALHTIRTSSSVGPDRRDSMLEEAINIILNGTKDRMKNYAQGLDLPVMAIYALGVLLPLIGLVLFPILLIFLQDFIKPIFLGVGYDVILPGVLLWLIHRIQKERPSGFSKSDLSLHPDLPEKGHFRILGKDLPALPIAVIIFLLITIPGIYGLYNFHQTKSLCKAWLGGGKRPEAFGLNKLECESVTGNFLLPTVLSLIPLWGFGIGVAFYLLGSTLQRARKREKLLRLEREFPTALFQLGNQISTGISVESALNKSKEKLRETEISELYGRSIRNIKNLNLTFKGSFFDKTYGALRYFPSVLIRNVMRVVVETVKKGVRMASLTMLTISRYLRNVQKVERSVREMVSDTATSMKFLAYFLAPLVAGITVTMAVVLLKILASIGAQLPAELGGGGKVGIGLPQILLGLKSSVPISVELFQLIVGIYAVETTLILTSFATFLERGKDPLKSKESVGKALLVSLTVYTLTTLLTYQLFGGSIEVFITKGM